MNANNGVDGQTEQTCHTSENHVAVHCRYHISEEDDTYVQHNDGLFNISNIDQLPWIATDTND